MAWLEELVFVLSRTGHEREGVANLGNPPSARRKPVRQRFIPALLIGALLAGVAHADGPDYGKVETFQPGKKYNCVPTPDHKAWNCNESGKATEPRQAQPTAEPTAPAPAAPEVPPPAPAPKASALPSYLTNAAASRPARTEAAPVQRAARADAANAQPASPAQPAEAAAAPAAQVPAEPLPAEKPATVSTPASPPATSTRQAPATEQHPPAVSTPSAPAQPVTAPETAARESAPAVATAGATHGNQEFLALPPASYVVEVAHGANRAELDALRANLHVPLGELYELHLTRDGADWWSLVWGHFADMDSARAARSDLPADAAVNAGWPRRIAPLQAEVRKSGD